MNKTLIIAGIDPGTTVGYAFLDIQGNILEINSEKHLDLDELIKRSLSFGRIVAVGTDKAKIPSFVEKFAISVGSRIFSPDEDMLSKDKAGITKQINTRNDHESDALASAFFALNKLNPLLTKIDSFIRQNKKQNIAKKLRELVLLKQIPIRVATDLIEKPQKEENVIINKVIEEKKLEEKDFLKLYTKLDQLERDNSLLRNQKNNLIKELKKAENKNTIIKKEPYEKTFNKLLRQREQRFITLDKKTELKDKEITGLKEEIVYLNNFLAKLGKNQLLKKLDNLGSVEFEAKNKLLSISEGDILLISNPNIISENTINKIKDKVTMIIYKEKPSKKIFELPFTFIDANKLDLEENKYFAITKKEQLQKETSSKESLNKVIEDYKKERLG